MKKLIALLMSLVMLFAAAAALLARSVWKKYADPVSESKE